MEIYKCTCYAMFEQEGLVYSNVQTKTSRWFLFSIFIIKIFFKRSCFMNLFVLDSVSHDIVYTIGV